MKWNYFGPEPTTVSNTACVPEKLLQAAKEIFEVPDRFDYFDGSPGYDTRKYPRGDHKLGQRVDTMGEVDKNGVIQPDNRADVNCAGLVYTPAWATGCNPKDKEVSAWTDVKPGDVFFFEQSNFWHTGFIVSAVTQTSSGYEFYIYHSLERGTGPTLTDRCVVDSKTLAVQIFHGQSTTPITEIRWVNAIGVEGTMDITKLKFTNVWEPHCCTLKPPPPGPPDPPHDPLVLDLDHNGIQTCGLEEWVRFDNDADGFKELSGWVASGDGVLMLDLNGNNRMDDGRELFGDFTILPDGTKAANGFQALAYYDESSVRSVLRLTIEREKKSATSNTIQQFPREDEEMVVATDHHLAGYCGTSSPGFVRQPFDRQIQIPD